jgi:hypothetical protein
MIIKADHACTNSGTPSLCGSLAQLRIHFTTPFSSREGNVLLHHVKVLEYGYHARGK